MDKEQLKGLKRLLNQFRRDYDLDSMTEFVYIYYIIVKIDELLGE